MRSLLDVVPPVADLASQPAVLFAGGPVEPQAAIALGMVTGDAQPEGWRPVRPPGGHGRPRRRPDAFSRRRCGSCGSSRDTRDGRRGQLEAEIAQGAWYVVDSLPQDAFDAVPDRLWSAVLRRQPWPLSAVATCPLDPTMN